MTRSSIATRAPQAGQAAHRGGGDHWVEAAPFANGLYRREGNLEPESSKQALQGMRALHELLGKTRRQSHEYHKGCEEREATIKQECGANADLAPQIWTSRSAMQFRPLLSYGLGKILMKVKW